MSSFYDKDELNKIGFRSVGSEVLISRKTSIYGAENMIIGSHVRIDDYTYLSGRIILGDYIHIAPFTALYGSDEGIEMKDYSTISSRGAIYACSDDYSGEYMTNPTVPSEFTCAIKEKVTIGMHVVIGTNSTVLPGVTIGDGCSVGAMSLVNKDLVPWGIYYGIPCKRYKDRKKKCLEYAEMMRNGGGYGSTSIVLH